MRKTNGRNKRFAEFLRENKSEIRKHSDSNVKIIDGVQVITSDDEWATESEWDNHYNEGGVDMKKNRALINIDYTKDFVAEDGKLTSGDAGQATEERNVAITEEFIQNGEFVVFAIDLHKEGDNYHPETKLFPPHNIEGTDGRKLYGRLEDVFQANKNANNVYWMDKTRYSAFAGTDLDLQLRAREITEIHLVGVCTDICVLHTAVDAYNKGFEIVIHEDAVASFDAEGHAWALRHFKGSIGATIVNKGDN